MTRAHRTAVMVHGIAYAVPDGQAPEDFAKARGWTLPPSDGARGPAPLALADQGRRKAGSHSDAGLPGRDVPSRDAERFIAGNLREGVRAGRLILARTAAARLGAAAYADALAKGKLVVHTVGQRRYVAVADVSALERAQTSGAAATIAGHIAATTSSRAKRRRRPPPDWMR